MDEPKALDSLFKEKIFRIPDYQRGYAWQHEQLKDFWEDLINLSGDRSHYTGVLTLKLIPTCDIAQSTKEFWLVDDHSYRVHHIVDGQQRLTTFIIFLQSFVDFIKALPENTGKTDESIFITESLSVAALQERYLFKIKPTGDKFRTYKFGYESDNPSYNYLRFRILGEEGGGSVEETFYTLNLSNAKIYFAEQLHQLHKQEGIKSIQDVYKKLTKQFLFNEYVIKEEFDVFVAFETMNNRGKKLSDLELLKNRLIYLATLYNETELDAASRKSLRDTINNAWKEVYHQLGRNKARPLNDDDFLRAHWTMYFKYSRQTGKDYIRFLLDEQFTPKKIHQKTEKEVIFEVPKEVRADGEPEDLEEEDRETIIVSRAQLEPTEIRDFVNSLKESAIYWFTSFYPDLAPNISRIEQGWIDRLNRLGMGYFRPLVMAILKNEQDESARVRIFQRIERFIFIAFRMNSAMANYGSSEFYNAARALDRKETNLAEIENKLDERLSYTFNEDGTLRSSDFYNLLFKKFKGGSGYYGWSALRYFLFEYELSLLSGSRHRKISWDDFVKTEKDRVSIEHIYPQTESQEWAECFASVPMERRKQYNSTLGNLLLLSMSINASLQNDSFANKKCVKYDPAGKKLRNAYSDGSHSEIEVSQEPSWGPIQIKNRGIRLLKFMEERWDFRFKNDEEKESLLFLRFPNDTGMPA
ncbi:MAG: DUF262 domain-containing protein [Nitrospira sp.]|nr:DUF262 domain-containing protein [Nitrospira sp.]